ncbi:hypothetical protein LQ567_01405 [Niabella pedocola]|uniref:Translation initiation factor IF-3 n=1 Tax=Niabella pedocola TaxID=1752077 RepID=A0ABS8PJY8_9BACT|nr:hypothetical protein [Niabella pedocola]MCD2421400.1 hypothetical protein [Niabella pedocola]
MAKPNKDLPSFVVYQPNKKEFHICLEAGNIYYIWRSNYPPTRDNRFARKITRLKGIMPKEIPGKQVYDRGTYSINKGDDKLAVEKKIRQGLRQRSFSFILNGKKLKGRFIIKQTSAGTVLQKFKDKFAAEEDVLGADLSRTIRLMIPGYDPRSIKLPAPEKRKEGAASKKSVAARATGQPPEEPLTADKTIGRIAYRFVFYHSDTGPDCCLVTNDRNEVLVLQKEKNQWQLLKSARGDISKKARALEQHAQALDQLREA